MKYNQFFEVCRHNAAFAELQDFFINFDGLKEIILKLELTMKDGDANFKLETEQLRLQFKRVLTEEIMKIDQVSGEIVQKLEHATASENRSSSPMKLGGKVLDLTTPTTVDFNMVIGGQDNGMDVTYRRALLVKQYCELNFKGVQQIVKEYDNLAGCAAGVTQQEQSLAAVKFLAFADGRIDRVVEEIEMVLLAKGEITSEAACRESVMQGLLVTNAQAQEVGTIQAFLQVVGMVLLHGPNGISTQVVAAPDTLASKGMKGSGKHSAYERTALRFNKLWQSMRPTSDCSSMPLLAH